MTQHSQIFVTRIKWGKNIYLVIKGVASPVLKGFQKDKTDHLMQTSCPATWLHRGDQKPQMKEPIYHPWTECRDHCGAWTTLPRRQRWDLPVHTCLPALCTLPVVRCLVPVLRCLVLGAHRCLCSPFACQQKFHKGFPLE